MIFKNHFGTIWPWCPTTSGLKGVAVLRLDLWCINWEAVGQKNLMDHKDQKGRGSEVEREMWSRGRERKKGREKDGWVKKVNRQVEDRERIPATVCFPAVTLCFSPDTFLFLILQDTPASLTPMHRFLLELAWSGLYCIEPQASN